MRQDTGGSEPIKIERDQRQGREPTDMYPAYWARLEYGLSGLNGAVPSAPSAGSSTAVWAAKAGTGGSRSRSIFQRGFRGRRCCVVGL